MEKKSNERQFSTVISIHLEKNQRDCQKSFIEKHSVLVITIMAILAGAFPLLGFVFIPMLLSSSKKG